MNSQTVADSLNILKLTCTFESSLWAKDLVIFLVESGCQVRRAGIGSPWTEKGADVVIALVVPVFVMLMCYI